MIVAQELRIGNWVNIEPPQDGYSGICMIEQIDRSRALMHCETEDYFIDKRLNEIEPIPLTPEILEKAGFDRLPLSSVKRYGIKTKLFYLQIEKGKCYLYGYRFYPYGLTTLHQLQNLYYALTGEELEINTYP